MANNRELSEFGGFVSVSNTDKTVGIATTVRITAGGLFVGAVQAIRADGTWGGSAAGIQGAQGTGGVQGTTGTQGTTGVQGVQGRQGITGSQGATGSQGTIGAQGATGTQGATGSQGTTGTTGTQGITGSGTQGTSGTSVVRGWVNWNNATVQASFNTTGITKNANGDYTVTWTNSIGSSNYACVMTSAPKVGTNSQYNIMIAPRTSTTNSVGTVTKTATTIRVKSENTNIDSEENSVVAIFS